MPENSNPLNDIESLISKQVSKPLVSNHYTADPSAHVFNGKIYIYPSHDIDAGIPFDDLGSHFAMEDYRVYSMDRPDGAVTDHGVALHVKDIPWAERQLWAPDAAEKDGRYYLYFPAKRPDGIFQIGVATSNSPAGPFTPAPNPITGSYSIDPCVFKDDDGSYYLYFGGLWGGQLQHYRNNQYNIENKEPAPQETALGPLVARLSQNMLDFAAAPGEIIITDENGQPLLAGDNQRRFFEASWMHKYRGKYYFSYSTGDSHLICYAIGDNPCGPFRYAGIVLNPVIGWTNHHSIMEFEGRWWLFYHDSSLSGGITHLRSVKVSPLEHDENGLIKAISAYGS
jgi:hypothetical protein